MWLKTRKQDSDTKAKGGVKGFGLHSRWGMRNRWDGGLTTSAYKVCTMQWLTLCEPRRDDGAILRARASHAAQATRIGENGLHCNWKLQVSAHIFSTYDPTAARLAQLLLTYLYLSGLVPAVDAVRGIGV